MKKQMPIRLTDAEKARIRSAADERGQSISRYMVLAALAAAEAPAPKPAPPQRLGAAARDAIAALAQAGMPQREAKDRVTDIVAASPELEAAEIMRQVYRNGTE